VAKRTRAAQALLLESRIAAKLDRSVRTTRRKVLPRPRHWKSEEEYMAKEVPLRDRGWPRNPFFTHALNIPEHWIDEEVDEVKRSVLEDFKNFGGTSED
jgi:hypothetical protein